MIPQRGLDRLRGGLEQLFVCGVRLDLLSWLLPSLAALFDGELRGHPGSFLVPRHKLADPLPAGNRLVELLHPGHRLPAVPIDRRVTWGRFVGHLQIPQLRFVMSPGLAGLRHGQQRRHVPRVAAQVARTNTQHRFPIPFCGGLSYCRCLFLVGPASAPSLPELPGEHQKQTVRKVEVSRIGSDACGQQLLGACKIPLACQAHPFGILIGRRG